MSQIMRDINEITRCNIQYRADSLAPMGLKACHGRYIMEICDEPGISQDQLAARICINKSNVARQAAALELLPQIQQIMDNWSQDLLQDLTPAEIEALSAVLAKMKHRASVWMKDD